MTPDDALHDERHKHTDSTNDRLAALLAEHVPTTQPPMGLVVGCSCGWRIGRTLYESYAAHVAAVLTEAGVGFVAEAERERDRIEALIEASSLGTAEAKAARESVPHSTGVALAVAARHLARAERAEAALAMLTEDSGKVFDALSRVRRVLDEDAFYIPTQYEQDALVYADHVREALEQVPPTPPESPA